MAEVNIYQRESIMQLVSICAEKNVLETKVIIYQSESIRQSEHINSVWCYLRRINSYIIGVEGGMKWRVICLKMMLKSRVIL